MLVSTGGKLVILSNEPCYDKQWPLLCNRHKKPELTSHRLRCKAWFYL